MGEGFTEDLRAAPTRHQNAFFGEQMYPVSLTGFISKRWCFVKYNTQSQDFQRYLLHISQFKIPATMSKGKVTNFLDTRG